MQARYDDADRKEVRHEEVYHEEREPESTEFYEAMPGTMDDRRYIAREDDRVADHRGSSLAWIIIPLLLLIGLLVWAMSGVRTNAPSGTGTGTGNTNVAPGAQQNSSY